MRYIRGIWLLVLIVAIARGEDRTVSGVVTYLTPTSVYASLGTDAGVKDSTLLFAVVRNDTLARLRVIAVSSKSSLCQILWSSKDLAVGSKVVGTISIANGSQDTLATRAAAPPSAFAASMSPIRAYNGKGDPVMVRGRISAQFYGTRHQESAYNVTQPGVVFDIKAQSRDIPLTFDLYTNLRTQSYGENSPFSEHSINRTRIYRMALAYQPGANSFTLGRFYPSVVPSIGYIDGVMASTSVRRFSFGAAAGFQPSYTQRGVSNDYKKFVVFTSYNPDSLGTAQVTLAYARTYYLTLLDREAASFNGRLSLSPSLFLYANTDVDLRGGSGNGQKLSPRISQVIVNANYRVFPALGVGVGANAVSPLYPYSVISAIPANLINRQLRGSVNLSIYLYLPAGISLTNTYAPRTFEGSFADNFSEYASLTFANIGYSGVTVRSNLNMSENRYTQTHGFGVNLIKNWWEVFDLTVRFQQSSYTVKGFELSGQNKTLGFDVMIPIGRTFALTGTYERLESPGILMNTIFAEASVRF